MTDDELSVLCRALSQVKTERERIAASDKELSGKERELKDCILELLDEKGLQSAKLSDGTGTVSIRTTDYASFADPERGMEFMFGRMAEAKADGLPLVDRLILTKAVLKSAVVDWAEKELRKAGEDSSPNTIARKLEEIGVRYGTKRDVSLLRGKKE
jgi:hypothetical protein